MVPLERYSGALDRPPSQGRINAIIEFLEISVPFSRKSRQWNSDPKTGCGLRITHTTEPVRHQSTLPDVYLTHSLNECPQPVPGSC